MTELQQKKLVEKIKKEYESKNKTTTKIDELKQLDKQVKNPARVFAYIFGSIGSLVLGTGMCLAMKIIGSMMPLGIAIGLVGIAMVSGNYFIYKKMLAKRKRKYADKIIARSNELLNEED